MKQIEYTIVIPCYSSGDWLKELVARIESVMNNVGSYEVILVNDSSPEPQTWEVIEKLARESDFIRGINLLYNVGQFRATLCGLEHSQGQFVITMDDDFQNPPEEIPKLVQAIKDNPLLDCIMGKFIRKQHSYLRNAGSRFLDLVMNRLYGKPTHITTSSFRIMTIKFARTITLYRMASPLLAPIVVSLSNKISNIIVRHEDRKYGQSGYNLVKCLRITLRSIVNSSIVPLRVFSVIGFITAGIAFSLVLYYFFRWYWGGISVPGYTSLILVVSFFSGMILAGVGLLGEYIGRIICELTGMPRYVVSEDTRCIRK